MNILITGGSRGIGFAIAQKLAGEGHNLWLLARQREGLNKAQQQLPHHSNHHICAVDLAQAEQVISSAQELAQQGVKFDALVLNAGIFKAGAVSSGETKNLESVLQVNLIANQTLLKSYLPLVNKKGGKIVIIGSTSAYGPYPDSAICSIAKWGLKGLAVNLREELRSQGIGVTFLSPGDTNTSAWDGEPVDTSLFVQPQDIAAGVDCALTLGASAAIEEMVIKPVQGDQHDYKK